MLKRAALLAALFLLVLHRPIGEFAIRFFLPRFLHAEVDRVEWRGREVGLIGFRMETAELTASFERLNAQVNLFPFALDLEAEHPYLVLHAVPSEPLAGVRNISFRNGTIGYAHREYPFAYTAAEQEALALFDEAGQPVLRLERQGSGVRIWAERFSPPFLDAGALFGTAELTFEANRVVHSTGSLQMRAGHYGDWLHDMEGSVEWQSGEQLQKLHLDLAGADVKGSISYVEGTGGRAEFEMASYRLQGRLFEGSQVANWIEASLDVEGERLAFLSLQQPVDEEGKLHLQWRGLNLDGAGHFAFSPEWALFTLDRLEGQWLDAAGSAQLAVERGELEVSWSGVRTALIADIWDGEGQIGGLPVRGAAGRVVWEEGQFRLDGGRCQSLLPIEIDAAYNQGLATFDLRGKGPRYDLFRVSGSGPLAALQVDPARSHLLGEPLNAATFGWVRGNPEFEWHGELPASALAVFPWDGVAPGSLQWHLVRHGETTELTAQGANWIWRGKPLAADLHVKGYDGVWRCDRLQVGPLLAQCALVGEEGGLRCSEGSLTWDAQGTLAFEGSVQFNGHFDFRLPQLRIDADPFHLFGAGHFSGDGPHWELDLDLPVASFQAQGFTFENLKPLHLFLSPEGGLFGREIEFQLHNPAGLAAQGEVEWLHVDLQAERILLQEGSFRIPLGLTGVSFLNADLLFHGDVTLTRSGAQFSGREEMWGLNGFELQAREGYLAAQCALPFRDRTIRCSLVLSDAIALTLDDGTPGGPLHMHAALEPFRIDSIQGAIDGFNGAFSEEEPGQLRGKVDFDFRTAAALLPHLFDGVTRELKLGGGYRLIGTLTAPFSFQGVLHGAQCQLFNFELDSLFARAEFDLSHLLIQDFAIADRAGALQMPRMDLVEGERWTLSIPAIHAQEIRPSLLKHIGRPRGELGPLIVRDAHLHNFQGIAEDGKTHTAKGELSFINTFRRASSLFDIPSDFLGRIFGFDLELMIPAIGDVNFELRDGRYWITAAQNVFSEGKRAQFYLVNDGLSPSMDLNGNLSILIKMKQYVLLKITEPLLIAVDGKLDDPHFRLSKSAP